MKKQISVLLLMLALLLSGCNLARTVEEKTPDTMIGVLITREHLEQERLDATAEVDGHYSFPGVDGDAVLCYDDTDEEGTYTRCQGGAWFTDGHWAVKDTDEGVAHSFTGKVRVPTGSGQAMLCCNPVYQTADGEVYVLAGQGTALSGDRVAGESFSHKLEDTRTETENGQTRTRSLSVEVTLEAAPLPEQIVLVELDERHAVLSETAHTPGTVPEELTLTGACLLVESHNADGSVTRAVYSPGDEALATGYCAENGLLLEQQTTLVWPMG